MSEQQKRKVIYLIGSLANEEIPKISNKIERETGFEVFDSWWSPGRKTDTYWMEYELERGRSHKEAMNGYHVWNVFTFDKYHLDRADIAVMIMPAGKSGHAEMGYFAHSGKPVYILYEGNPSKYDVMQRFAREFFYNLEELIQHLKDKHDTDTGIDKASEDYYSI